MSRTIYVYENHLYGHLYSVDHELSYDEAYCDECGDTEHLVCVINSLEDIKKFIEHNTQDYCCDCNKYFASDKYDHCPYCGSVYIECTGSCTDHEYIYEFAEELQQWFKEDA